MKKEEIDVYASEVTRTTDITEVVFNDGKKITGYFEGNSKVNKDYSKNIWNFYHKGAAAEYGSKPINGEDIKRITITRNVIKPR